MNNLLELPTGENSLLAAHKAIEEGRSSVDSEDLQSLYLMHFVPAVPPVSVQPPVFERFSLIDPTIRTIIRSTTASF